MQSGSRKYAFLSPSSEYLTYCIIVEESESYSFRTNSQYFNFVIFDTEEYSEYSTPDRKPFLCTFPRENLVTLSSKLYGPI